MKFLFPLALIFFLSPLPLWALSPDCAEQAPSEIQKMIEEIDLIDVGESSTGDRFHIPKTTFGNLCFSINEFFKPGILDLGDLREQPRFNEARVEELDEAFDKFTSGFSGPILDTRIEALRNAVVKARKFRLYSGREVLSFQNLAHQNIESIDLEYWELQTRKSVGGNVRVGLDFTYGFFRDQGKVESLLKPITERDLPKVEIYVSPDFFCYNPLADRYENLPLKRTFCVDPKRGEDCETFRTLQQVIYFTESFPMSIIPVRPKSGSVELDWVKVPLVKNPPICSEDEFIR